MEQLKAVQMDLARQKETLEQVFEFFKLASRYNYNAVVLYLEDRVKTESYQYISDEESYSPDEIKKMVSFASELNLELIPVVCNFSHTDGFFEHEEMRCLAELRNGDEGFFTEKGNPIYTTACPLLPESQHFFDNYFKEIASLFPSKYFIAGLDEDFNIGSCELCRADVEAHGGIGHLFLNHVIRTNNVLKALGKQMLMFDDMFYFCPEVLPDVPKNIIMCTWSYDYIERYPRCQFGNNMQKDIFREYDRLGLKYIVVPWTNFHNNVDTFTKYAENYSPVGYLNTTWGMTAETMHFTYPLIAYAGMLWNGEYINEPMKRMKKAVAETCELSDEAEITIVAEAVSKVLNLRAGTYSLCDEIVRRSINFDDFYKDIAYNYDLLKNIKSDNVVVNQIKYRAKRSMLMYELMMIAQDVFDMRTGTRRADKEECVRKLENIRAELVEIFREQHTLWEKYRGGIPNTYLKTEEARIISDNDKLLAIAKNMEFEQNGYLDIVFLLPDQFGSYRVEIDIKYEDGDVIHKKGLYKPLNAPTYTITDKGPYWYTVSFLTDASKAVESCSISIKGMGAINIEYVEGYAKGRKYIPNEVIAVGGRVENPENILRYDTRWCSIGNDDMIETMNNREKRREKSTINIMFKEEK